MAGYFNGITDSQWSTIRSLLSHKKHDVEGRMQT